MWNYNQPKSAGVLISKKYTSLGLEHIHNRFLPCIWHLLHHYSQSYTYNPSFHVYSMACIWPSHYHLRSRYGQDRLLAIHSFINLHTKLNFISTLPFEGDPDSLTNPCICYLVFVWDVISLILMVLVASMQNNSSIVLNHDKVQVLEGYSKLLKKFIITWRNLWMEASQFCHSSTPSNVHVRRLKI